AAAEVDDAARVRVDRNEGGAGEGPAAAVDGRAAEDGPVKAGGHGRGCVDDRSAGAVGTHGEARCGGRDGAVESRPVGRAIARRVAGGRGRDDGGTVAVDRRGWTRIGGAGVEDRIVAARRGDRGAR